MLHGIRTISISVTIGAVAFWATDITGRVDRWDPRAMDIDDGAAVMAGLSAVVLWLAFVVLRHVRREFRRMDGRNYRREDLLIRTFDRALSATKPFRQIP